MVQLKSKLIEPVASPLDLFGMGQLGVVKRAIHEHGRLGRYPCLFEQANV